MTRKQILSLACTTVLSASTLLGSSLHAQQPPPAPGPGSPGGRPMGPGMRHGHDGPEGHGMGMGIVPPGTWWRSPDLAQKLALTADQQKKMDDILLQNRIQLIHMHASLEEEQLKLDPLLNANPPDSGRAYDEISKLADLRADLEKTNAKMLLGLRDVLNADQWSKLRTMGPMLRADAMHHDGDDKDKDHDKHKDARKDDLHGRARRSGPGSQGRPGSPGGPGGPDTPAPPPPPPASL